MPAKDSVSFSLQLPLFWWRRLQRVSERCHTSPHDFVREILEAEVVRRELRDEPGAAFEDDWLTTVTDPIPPERLH
jgi:hypothetical protein